MEIRIPVKENIGAWILRFAGRVTPRLLAKAAGGALYQCVMDHFDFDVSKRHTSANHLGATPTKHWSNPETYVHQKNRGVIVDVTVSRPGIARAVRDVTIRPKRGRAITIPMHALAYGRRPAEAEQYTGKKIFRPKGSRILVSANKDGTLNLMYLLSGAVFQKQDTTLLPGEDAVIAALHRALKNAITTEAKKC